MSPELDQQLCQKYPLIFKPRRRGARQASPSFGFSHADGWFNIIDVLCEQLYAPYLRAKEQYQYARKFEGTAPWRGAEVITAVSVERKRLAMKAAADALPTAEQVKEKFGTLRFYVREATPEQYALIEFAEAMSARTCEKCGSPGTPRAGGWVRTLCDHHAALSSSSAEAPRS